MSYEFEWDVMPDMMMQELTTGYITAVRTAISGVLLSYVPQVEAYLKTNAPWTDRTGNLRASMYAEFEAMADALVLKMDYGLDYGVFLEFANSGSYQVVAPALDFFAPKIWTDIQGLFA